MAGTSAEAEYAFWSALGNKDGWELTIEVDNPQRTQIVLSSPDLHPVMADLRTRDSSSVSVLLQHIAGQERLTFRAHSDGWELLEATEDFEVSDVKPRYVDTEVMALLPSNAKVVSTIDKQGWGNPWIGWSTETFLKWSEQVGYLTTAETLFRNGNGRLASFILTQPPQVLGHLAVGGLDVTAPDLPVPAWPDPQPKWIVAAALLPRDESSSIALALSTVAVAAGLMVILGVSPHTTGEGIVYEVDRPVPARIVLFDKYKPDAQTNEILQKLAHWVTLEPNQTRLSIARRVLLEHIDAQGKVSTELTILSEMAYRAAVDEQVSSALRAQADFENHIVSFVNKQNDFARGFDKQVDDTVLRALTAVLAVFVGSVVSRSLDGMPALAASGLVAAYIFWTARTSMGSFKADIQSVQSVIHKALQGRPDELREESRQRVDSVIEGIIKRVEQRTLHLYVVAVLVILFGLFMSGLVGELRDAVAGSDGPSVGPMVSPTIVPTQPTSTP